MIDAMESAEVYRRDYKKHALSNVTAGSHDAYDSLMTIARSGRNRHAKALKATRSSTETMPSEYSIKRFKVLIGNQGAGDERENCPSIPGIVNVCNVATCCSCRWC